ncbi:MAG: hypothetical protein EON54_00295 [Alcaligenaceae bacterium]|nr:MAG: hypothetical protein EON54_00295 [Alcaligenaceae bacterium]
MTSLIKSLSLKNFKGFSDEVRIGLRPITLLFGANSAGKSSILHALQYAREILERNNANADRTLQGGDAVDLGGFLNLVHGRQPALELDPDRRIEIEIEMVLGDTSIPELVPDAFEDWQTHDSDVWFFYEALQTVRRKVSTVSVRLIVGWNGLRNEPIVVGYEIGTNGAWCVKFESTADGRDVRMRINKTNPIFLVEGLNADDLLADMDDWINPNDLAEDTKDELTEIAAAIKESPAAPVIVSVWGEVFDAVKESGMERPGDGLRAWLVGFSGALPRLDQMLFIPAPGAKGAANVYIAREFTAFLSWLTIGPAMLLREQLRKLRYIGPLRSIPPRDFDVSLTKSEAAWSDGMAGWETLMSGSERLLSDCSEWMSSPDKLGTGYSISRRQMQEFDLSKAEPKAVGRPRPRLALVDASGLSHQPQDVGVGISQVLPVVIAAQDSNASLVCIEQPELHIHPAVQVGLGDLFIDGSLKHELSFLIETHSEHLILRLLRRVRESAEDCEEGALPVLTADLIGVNYLSKEGGSMAVTLLPINADGDFDNPWPRGFFEERGPELF